MTILTLEDLRKVDQMDLVEAMRAKCEAIARAVANDGGVDESEYRTAVRIADAIAALRVPERPAEQILEERFPYLRESRRP